MPIKGGRRGGGRDRAKRGRSAVGLSTERFSLFHSSVASFCAGFGEACVALRNARVLPAAPPTYLFLSVRLRTGIGICSPTCSVVTDPRSLSTVAYYFVFVNIFTHSCLSVSASNSRLCAEGSCPRVSTLARNRFSSLLPPLLLFGTRPRWSRLVSPRTRIITRQRMIGLIGIFWKVRCIT